MDDGGRVGWGDETQIGTMRQAIDKDKDKESTRTNSWLLRTPPGRLYKKTTRRKETNNNQKKTSAASIINFRKGIKDDRTICAREYHTSGATANGCWPVNCTGKRPTR